MRGVIAFAVVVVGSATVWRYHEPVLDWWRQAAPQDAQASRAAVPLKCVQGREVRYSQEAACPPGFEPVTLRPDGVTVLEASQAFAAPAASAPQPSAAPPTGNALQRALDAVPDPRLGSQRLDRVLEQGGPAMPTR